jgi:transcriptional regulator with PAS, ATPase and Fis domain
MRWADLEARNLFELSTSGTHRFATGRVTLLDAGTLAAVVRLPSELSNPKGPSQFLSALGYIEGWRVADHVLATIPSASTTEVWQFAGSCAAWLGLGRTADSPLPVFPMLLLWRQSPEAEHSLDTRRVPSCSFLAGVLAGSATRILGKTVSCVEVACVVEGHENCRFLATSEPELSADVAYHLGRLRDIAESVSQIAQSRQPVHQQQVETDDPGLGARSAQMRRLMALAARVAPLDLTVLITGESGVGKERVAEFLHSHSQRAAAPYLPLNCAALSDALLESELFGHRRGAFTGAHEEHRGLFEAASGGTLFLDEIGEVSQSLQATLLRVLQERKVRRIGETHYRNVDVRVIAATNRDLEREVREGRFRRDLFYRLNEVTLHVPPLRERQDDLRLLLRTVLATTAIAMKRDIDGYTPHALHALLNYSWPGNIRELENAIRRSCAVASGTRIELADLPDALQRREVEPGPSHATKSLREVERDHILAVLHAEGGNRAKAAERLEISRQTLFRRMREYRIS